MADQTRARPGTEGASIPVATPARRRSTQLLLVVLGWASVVLAVIGAFLPLLPTVPLLLLAAFCFARSSARCHRWLLDHPRLGPVVLAYQGGKIPRRARTVALVLIWISIPLSAWLAPLLWVRLLLLGIGLAISVYLLRLPAE